MEKKCWHCNGPIGLTRRLRGELFCSKDHEQLYHAAESVRAMDRVKTSAPGEKKPLQTGPPAAAPVAEAPAADTTPIAMAPPPPPPIPIPAPVAAAPTVPPPVTIPPLPPAEPRREPEFVEPPPGRWVKQAEIVPLPPSEYKSPQANGVLHFLLTPVPPTVNWTPAAIEFEVRPSGSLALPLPVRDEIPTGKHTPELDFLNGSEPAIPAFQAEIAVERRDQIPSSPALIEWNAKPVKSEDPENLAPCDPLWAQTAAPQTGTWVVPELDPRAVSPAEPVIAEWPISRASDWPRVDLNRWVTAEAAMQRIPAYSGTVVAPLLDASSVLFEEEPPSSREMGAAVPPSMFGDLPRRSVPQYQRVQSKPREIDWRPPADTEAHWALVEVPQDSKLAARGQIQAVTEQRLPGSGRAIGRVLGMGGQVEATLVEKDAPGVRQGTAGYLPLGSPSLTLRVHSGVIEGRAVVRTWSACELPAEAALGDRYSTVDVERAFFWEIPAVRVGQPVLGIAPPAPGSAFAQEISLAHADDEADSRVGAMGSLGSTVALAFGLFGTALPTALSTTGLAESSPAAVDPALEAQVGLNAFTEFQPGLVVRHLHTILAPLRPISGDRRAEHRFPETKGDTTSLPPDWIVPTRARPAYLLAPLPLAKARLEYTLDAFPYYVPPVVPELTCANDRLSPEPEIYCATWNVPASLPAPVTRRGTPEVVTLRDSAELTRFLPVPDYTIHKVRARAYTQQPTEVVIPAVVPERYVPEMRDAGAANVFRLRVRHTQSFIQPLGIIPIRRGTHYPPFQEPAGFLVDQNWAQL